YLAPSITSFFYLSVTVTPDCSTLSLHDALPIFEAARGDHGRDTVFSLGLEPRGPRAEKAANQFIRPFGGRHVEYPGHQSGLDEGLHCPPTHAGSVKGQNLVTGPLEHCPRALDAGRCISKHARHDDRF